MPAASRTASPRPPYQPGDQLRGLYLDSQHGTCLATFTVTSVLPSAERGWWEISADLPGSADAQGLGATTVQARVNADGRDRHGYVQRVRPQRETHSRD